MSARKSRLRRLRLFLRLPGAVQAMLARCGVARDVHAPARLLRDSAGLAPLPPAARWRRVRHLLLAHADGQAVGSQTAGFYPFLIPPGEWAEYPDLAHDRGRAPAACLLPVVDPDGRSGVPMALALHVHAYYVDGLADLRRRLALNQRQPDLIVTGPEANRAAVAAALAGYRANWRFVPCDNIGRDIAAFLSVLGGMIAGGYALIGHVHLKQSRHNAARSYVARWSGHLLSATIADPDHGIAAIDALAADAARRVPAAALYIPHMTDPVG